MRIVHFDVRLFPPPPPLQPSPQQLQQRIISADNSFASPPSSSIVSAAAPASLSASDRLPTTEHDDHDDDDDDDDGEEEEDDEQQTPLFIAGQLITGRVEMRVAGGGAVVGKLAVGIRGLAETGWSSSRAVCHSSAVVCDELVDLTDVLFEQSLGGRLAEGPHEIPFRIRVPLDVLSSVEIDGLGGVNYMCTATLELPDENNIQLVAETPLRLYSALNLDADFLRESAFASARLPSRHACCGFPRLRKGERRKVQRRAEMAVDELGLLPGEVTRIRLEVMGWRKRRKWTRLRQAIFGGGGGGQRRRPCNAGPEKGGSEWACDIDRSSNDENEDAHECMLLTLCQQIDFVAAPPYGDGPPERRSVTLAVHTHSTCAANTTGSPDTCKWIELRIPPQLPPTSVQANRLITVSYFFKLSLPRLDVIVPVVIGTSKTPGPLQ